MVKRIAADDKLEHRTKMKLTQFPESLPRGRSTPVPSEKIHAHALPRRALNAMHKFDISVTQSTIIEEGTRRRRSEVNNSRYV